LRIYGLNDGTRQDVISKTGIGDNEGDEFAHRHALDVLLQAEDRILTL
jgi:hypothetical protein